MSVPWIVSFYTLGCKLNQLESESIVHAFRKEGFSIIPWGEKCHKQGNLLLLINTCTVTSKSEQKARRLIRKALKDYPEAILIVTGCYAQMEAEVLESLDPGSSRKRLFIIPGDRKNRILELPVLLSNLNIRYQEDLLKFLAVWAKGENNPAIDDSFCFSPGEFSFHSRAFIKIQDGCDNQCSYCRTRFARGKSRSIAPEEALSTLYTLENGGYEEAVLTGVNISLYKGGQKSMNLAELLYYLLSGTKRIRIRLSSIEPELFNPAFVSIISHERVRPHFHFSIQSASHNILSRMKRSYTPEEALEGIMLLRSARDDPFLGCDIITGFPGESPKEFEKTYIFCQNIGFPGIHVFPFSRRPGTEAWNFKERVSEREAGYRVEKLVSLAQINRSIYIERWTGRTVEAIVEKGEEQHEHTVQALSANYLKLLVSLNKKPLPKAGSLIQCKIIEKTDRFDALAEIV